MQHFNLPKTVAFRRRIPLVSSKQKILIMLLLVLFSCLSGSGEIISNFQTKDSVLFVKNNTSSKAFVTKAFKSVSRNSVSITPASQFQVLGISEQKDEVTASTNTSSDAWGVSKQIDEHTWTIKIANDSRSATAQEILDALNVYRQKHNKGTLTWDNELANYAKSRADSFNSAGTLDAHKGFMDFVNNQDGFHKLGFGGLGENSSIGYMLEAVHLIEWVYASDKPHDDNQLSSNWSYVGIGISGTATDLVFGGNKL